MRKFWNSNRKPITLEVKVLSRGKQDIVLNVLDSMKPWTVYASRMNSTAQNRDGDWEKTFHLRLPISPQRAVIQVYNRRNGDKPEGADNTIMIKKMDELPLQTFPECFDSRNSLARRSLKFLEEFSENAAILSANESIYLSDDKHFRIDYLDVIIDTNPDVINPNTGKTERNKFYMQELKTPSRIRHVDGCIQVAKKYFIRYPVPGRMAILLHEIAHFYIADDINDEITADLEALKIYLGMGFPMLDAGKVFLEVFAGSDSPINRERTKKILAFFDEFTKKKYKIAA